MYCDTGNHWIGQLKKIAINFPYFLAFRPLNIFPECNRFHCQIVSLSLKIICTSIATVYNDNPESGEVSLHVKTEGSKVFAEYSWPSTP